MKRTLFPLIFITLSNLLMHNSDLNKKPNTYGGLAFEQTEMTFPQVLEA